MKIVVKIEIDTLLDDSGDLDKGKFERMIMVLSNLSNSGAELLIVSSGAIFLGSRLLGKKEMPSGKIEKQAFSAIGQVELMNNYRYYFDIYDHVAAQLLLTAEDFTDKTRKNNTSNTLSRLLSKKIIPIINENDSVSTEDIDMEDNYYLVSRVAEISDAQMILEKSKENGNYRLLSTGNSFEEFMLSENELVDTLHNATDKAV